LIGDHGGYQKSETRVAQRLNKAWAKDGKAARWRCWLTTTSRKTRTSPI
jgi:hypothetical protein